MPKNQKPRTRHHAKPISASSPTTIPPPPPLTASPSPAAVVATTRDEQVLLVHRTVAPAEQLSVLPNEIQDTAAPAAAVSKKTKRQQRHDKWMEKLGTVYKHPKKNTKPKPPTALDLTGMRDVLPSLDHDPTEPTAQSQSHQRSTPITTTTKPTPASSTSTPVSQKARRKAGVAEILRLQKVLAHPTFKQAPLRSIRRHLENNLAIHE
ncbi:ribosome biogenesis protein SLX9-domain-containing protein [Powellomyces hirtus]|nr:ribosome biogenesis protein SLX9-domain-containing protein [Powellomyces hirtus]